MANCNCENMAKLDAILTEQKGKPGALIPVLQQAQQIFGYLPRDVMTKVAEQLSLPLSQVYGVATFYAQFHLNPRGRNIIRVCVGTACHVRGASLLLDQIRSQLDIEGGQTTADLKYTLEPVACIGACGLAPVLMINDQTHGRLTPEKIASLLE